MVAVGVNHTFEQRISNESFMAASRNGLNFLKSGSTRKSSNAFWLGHSTRNNKAASKFSDERFISVKQVHPTPSVFCDLRARGLQILLVLRCASIWFKSKRVQHIDFSVVRHIACLVCEMGYLRILDLDSFCPIKGLEMPVSYSEPPLFVLTSAELWDHNLPPLPSIG